jgi:hypothetical protein
MKRYALPGPGVQKQGAEYWTIRRSVRSMYLVLRNPYSVDNHAWHVNYLLLTPYRIKVTLGLVFIFPYLEVHSFIPHILHELRLTNPPVNAAKQIRLNRFG